MAPTQTEVTIREFEPGDEAAFQRLNEEWIVEFFDRLEPMDQAAIHDPRRNILEPGGRIFFAVCQQRIVGCCALMVGPHGYEVAKMAVTVSARGGGIGRKLLKRVIAAARQAGAQRLFLETNRKLTPAIWLYESAGFRHLPPERFYPTPYVRSNVQMELELVSGN
jgi:GNAT superfamily N-acetyltransferase